MVTHRHLACACVFAFGCAHPVAPPPTAPTPPAAQPPAQSSCDGVALHELVLAAGQPATLAAGDTLTLQRIDRHVSPGVEPTQPEVEVQFARGDQVYDWVLHETQPPMFARGYCVRVARIDGDVPTLELGAVPSAH